MVNLEYDHFYETGTVLITLWQERKEKSKNGIDFGFHIVAGLLHSSKFFLEGKYRILKTDIGDGLSYDGIQITLGRQYKW